MSHKLLLLTLLFATNVFGQDTHDHERCNAHSITERILEQQGLSTDLHPSLPRQGGNDRNGILTIPVVVHVVWNTTAENVPSAAIAAMVNEMNQDFSQSNSDLAWVRAAFTPSIANVGIQFCLAEVDPQGNATTGITRTQTSVTWFNPDTQTDAMKSAPLGRAPWDPTQYLNIWICDISSGASGGSVTLGYAYLPIGGVVGSSIDGLVIDYQYGLPVGSRTATHEVGHYLGLLHPWGSGGCGNDDGFADTPNTDTPTFSCANTNLQKCGVLTQYENFMDYSNCPAMFTHGQRSYMRDILTGVRASLLDSPGCGSVPGVCIPTSANGPSEGDYVNSVILGSINNVNSGGTGMPAYTDYTGAWNTSLQQGSTHTISIQGGEYHPNHYAAWIDYNQDNVFQANEKLGEFTTNFFGQTQTIDFTVPQGAIPGNTVLRVRGVYHNTNEPTPTDPCFDYAFGETEDYRIVIIGQNTGQVCIPSSLYGTSDGDYINGVLLGNINNANSGGPSGPAYNNYTHLSTTLTPGVPNTLTIQGGEYFPDHYAAWIDLNGDQVFSPNEKLGEFTTSASYQTQTIGFTVPTNATLGTTILRIRGVYHDSGEPSPTDPCFDYAFGETEDYSVSIELSTGVEGRTEDQVSIYPNPAMDQVTVELGSAGNSTLILMDALGRVVATYSTQADRFIMPLNTIMAGHYIVQVIGDGSRSVHRLEVLGR